jgi:hypothetical protein
MAIRTITDRDWPRIGELDHRAQRLCRPLDFRATMIEMTRDRAESA